MTTVLYGFSVSAPLSTPTVENGTLAGNLSTATGTYKYKVTYVTAFGETDPSAASATVTTTVGSVNLTVIPTSGEVNVISRKIYRTAEGIAGTYRLVATLANNTATTYTDTLADANLGVDAPTSNTAHSRSLVQGQMSVLFPMVKSSAGLPAAGSTATDAALLSPLGVHFITGADATKGVKLPQDTRTVGSEVVVKNEDAVNALKVYPFGTSDTINGSTGAFTLAANTSKTFHVVPSIIIVAWKTY